MHVAWKTLINYISFLFIQDVQNLTPATDFYKKFALDCAAEQVAVDLFLLSGQYADLATLSKFVKQRKLLSLPRATAPKAEIGHCI